MATTNYTFTGIDGKKIATLLDLWNEVKTISVSSEVVSMPTDVANNLGEYAKTKTPRMSEWKSTYISDTANAQYYTPTKLIYASFLSDWLGISGVTFGNSTLNVDSFSLSVDGTYDNSQVVRGENLTFSVTTSQACSCVGGYCTCDTECTGHTDCWCHNGNCSCNSCNQADYDTYDTPCDCYSEVNPAYCSCDGQVACKPDSDSCYSQVPGEEICSIVNNRCKCNDGVDVWCETYWGRCDCNSESTTACPLNGSTCSCHSQSNIGGTCNVVGPQSCTCNDGQGGCTCNDGQGGCTCNDGQGGCTCNSGQESVSCTCNGGYWSCNIFCTAVTECTCNNAENEGTCSCYNHQPRTCEDWDCQGHDDGYCTSNTPTTCNGYDEYDFDSFPCPRYGDCDRYYFEQKGVCGLDSCPCFSEWYNCNQCYGAYGCHSDNPCKINCGSVTNTYTCDGVCAGNNPECALNGSLCTRYAGPLTCNCYNEVTTNTCEGNCNGANDTTCAGNCNGANDTTCDGNCNGANDTTCGGNCSPANTTTIDPDCASKCHSVTEGQTCPSNGCSPNYYPNTGCYSVETPVTTCECTGIWCSPYANTCECYWHNDCLAKQSETDPCPTNGCGYGCNGKCESKCTCNGCNDANLPCEGNCSSENGWCTGDGTCTCFGDDYGCTCNSANRNTCGCNTGDVSVYSYD